MVQTMSKPYTEDDLSTQLQQDRTWRLREISDLKTVALRSDDLARNVLLRALVTVCYAHWEGSVRFAARKFLEHVALRKFRYRELDRQFLRNYFLPRLTSLSSSKASVTERCALVDDIISASDYRFSKVNENIVSTRSNLSSDVFRDICLVCGVGFDQFEDEVTFIDVVLLKRRNEIAHGEDTRQGMDDLDKLIDGTLGLMRTFGNAVENRVCQREYCTA